MDPAELPGMLAPVFANHGEIAVAYVFGSVARGEAGPDSDLDVGLVYGSAPRDTHDRIGPALADTIARRTGIDRVDLIDLVPQGPLFCHQVLCEGVRLYESDPFRRVDFESDVVAKALDFRPTYELATRGKVAALRRWLRERYDLRSDPIAPRRAPGQSRETG